jgi:hypothetical protein
VDSSYVYCGTRVSIRGATGSAGAAGAAGKTAYQYAQDGGYTGTEAEFAQKLAAESYGYVAQPEPPEDTNLLWIDTDDNSEESGSAPADWNAAEGEPGHVRNRTHYSEYKNVTLLDNVTIVNMGDTVYPFAIVEGQTYTVVYNGVEYTEVGKSAEISGSIMFLLGNGMMVGSSDINPEHPYSVVYMESIGGCAITPVWDDEAVISISTYQEVVHKLPDKYVNIPDYRPYYAQVFNEGSSYYTSQGVAHLEQAYNSGRQIVLILTVMAESNEMRYLSYPCFIATMDGATIYKFYCAELDAYFALLPNDSGIFDVERIDK